MIMKLELKHLAPYLPYGLKVLCEALEGKIITHLESLDLGGNQALIYLENGIMFDLLEENPKCKPILRPLSDLTKEIDHNGKKFVPIKKLKEMPNPIGGFHTDRLVTIIENPNKFYIGEANYAIMEKLFEWHFDVFGLITKGLAIKKQQHTK